MFPLKRNDLLLAVLFIFLLAGYLTIIWPALTGPFIFDDFPNLQNLAILNGQINSSNLGKYLASFTGSPGRPIAALSFLINDYAWPSEPFSFRYTNALIHLLNAVLVFGFIRQLAKAAPKLPQHAIWPLLAMAIWLFHPIQISAQMLVVQRMTLLSATFSLVGLWAYIALLQRARTWQGAFLALAALGTATILAFLSKESGALLPLYALVLHGTLLRPLIAGKDYASRRLLFLGCALPSVVVIALVLQMGLQPGAYASREFTLAERLFTQCHVLADYLQQIVLPSLNGGGIYHDDFPIAKSAFTPISTLLYGVAILVISMLAFLKRARNPLVSFAALWFFAGHLMESTVLPLELYFEHRNYLPLLGLAIAITAWPFALNERRQTGFFFLGLWLAVLITATALRAPIWGQTAKMATFWAIEHPKSLRATQELARFYDQTADQHTAMRVLMHAYEVEGVRSADLPLASLLINCLNPGVNYKNVDLLAKSKEAIKSSQFSNGSLEILQKLNQLVQIEQCPKVLNRQDWWELSDNLLANPKFKQAGENFIRVERAKLRISEKDLRGTMKELDAAFTVSPTVELSHKIAEILISAGLLDDAESWLKKGLLVKQPFFDTLMYDPKDYSTKLLHELERVKVTQSRKN